MFFGSTPDPGYSTPDHPFVIDLIGGPEDGREHELIAGWPVPNAIGVLSLSGLYMHWYVIERDCSGSPDRDGRGRAVFDADLTRRMAK